MFDTQRLAAIIADAPPILIDHRLRRFPMRQDALLKNLFEVRQLGGGVRAGFSCWEEDGAIVYGHVVFDQSNQSPRACIWWTETASPVCVAAAPSSGTGPWKPGSKIPFFLHRTRKWCTSPS